MTDPEHDRLRVDLAGYVVGGLTVAEQQAVEAHLLTCDACRDELAELDPLPVLLDLARPATPTPLPTKAPAPSPALPPVAPDIDLSDTAAPEIAAPAGRRRGRVLAGTAAAAIFVAALLIGVAVGRPDSPSFSPPIALQAVGGSTASGSAALRAEGSGTVVRLDLDGLNAEDGSYYECLWTSNQGTQSAGTFRSAADGTAQVDLVTAARRYPGWSLEIVQHPPDTGRAEPDADGEVVLRADA